jgi:chloramphenicol-sensitive protein RarD
VNRGILYGIGAYLIWGFIPIWLKQINSVPAIQILGHRIVWSFFFLLAAILIRGQLGNLQKAALIRHTFRIYAIAALLLAANWLTYIYAVNSGHIVESSLGYFINPLVNVLFGLFFFKEKLRTWQWLPVGIASFGVVYLTFDYGRLPWIALTLALTFALYAVVKKAAPLGAFYGLTLETFILFPPALFYLIYLGINGRGAFGYTGIDQSLLLTFAGLITAVPLLMFGAAARSIPLTMVGLLQFIAPTCQFLLGVIVYQEAFTMVRLIGFTIIWIALIAFSMEGYLHSRRKLINAVASP